MRSGSILFFNNHAILFLMMENFEEIHAKISALRDSIEMIIKGKPEAVELTIVTLLAGGHLLIEDVPGVGKTTLAHALARSFDCEFNRIQFTSDLLPSDLTGISMYNLASGKFEFHRGPIFSNVVLADEINRATPKTQSALLEAMSEGSVTADDRTFPLPEPFIVVATQNPIEHVGTNPLPESQLDRFLIKTNMGYPSVADEKEILRSGIGYGSAHELTPAISSEEILLARKMASRVRIEEVLMDYLMSLVTATRNCRNLSLGVSTRGAGALFRSAQALAIVRGRDYCDLDDIKSLALKVFPHRVLVSPDYSSPYRQGEDAREIIHDLLNSVEVPV